MLFRFLFILNDLILSSFYISNCQRAFKNSNNMSTFSHMNMFCIKQPDKSIFIFEKFGFHLKNFESSKLLNIFWNFKALFNRIMMIISIFYEIKILREMIKRVFNLVAWILFINWSYKVNKCRCSTTSFWFNCALQQF